MSNAPRRKREIRLLNVSMSNRLVCIQYNGMDVTFEDHHYLGPILVHPRTLEALPDRAQPSPNSPFWLAAQRWYQQGKRTEPNTRPARAIWDASREEESK